MTPELQTNPRPKWVYLLAAGVVVVALAAMLALLQPGTDTVTFQVVDAEAGQPLSNITAIRYGRTTDLPIEKLRIGLNPWKATTEFSSDGRFRMKGTPRRRSNKLVFILFRCGASLEYSEAAFSVDDEGFEVVGGEKPPKRLAHTNFVSIGLYSKPKPKANER